MIHSSKDMTAIKGMSLDILQEYLAITYSIMSTEPEMFIAVHALLTDDAMELFAKLDGDKVAGYMKHAKIFIDENKKAGTWE